MSDTQAEVEELERASATAARLFDIRRIIGGLFTVYGLIVGITGLTDGKQAIDKAQGVNINLWTGLGMLVLGLLFLLWMKLSPPKAPEPAAGGGGDGTGGLGGAAGQATEPDGADAGPDGGAGPDGNARRDGDAGPGGDE